MLLLVHWLNRLQNVDVEIVNGLTRTNLFPRKSDNDRRCSRICRSSILNGTCHVWTCQVCRDRTHNNHPQEASIHNYGIDYLQ